jgi:hypothetical protein
LSKTPSLRSGLSSKNAAASMRFHESFELIHQRLLAGDLTFLKFAGAAAGCPQLRCQSISDLSPALAWHRHTHARRDTGCQGSDGGSTARWCNCVWPIAMASRWALCGGFWNSVWCGRRRSPLDRETRCPQVRDAQNFTGFLFDLIQIPRPEEPQDTLAAETISRGWSGSSTRNPSQATGSG